MKKNTNKDIKAILVRYFISIFSVLLIAALICGVEYSGDKSNFRLTGEHYETITFDEIKEAFFRLIDNNNAK